MTRSRKMLLGATGVVLLTLAGAASAVKPNDPIAVEIARWSEFLKTHQSNAEFWADTKKSAEPLLANAQKSLDAGRRLRALQFLGSARVALAGEAYASGFSREKLESESAFESEWKRMGTVLAKSLETPSPGALDGVRPAAIRAMAEAALPQVRAFYEASLEYGRNTMPVFGLYYIGAAQAQLEFADFCRSLSVPTGPPAPPLRSVAGELDGLENDLLAAYRPPAAIDRHSEFISASATVNEARELDAAGLRYGALMKYLQAAVRTAPLRPPTPPIDAAAITRKLAEFETRLSDPKVDHSVGRLLLQTAQMDIALAEPGAPTPAAAAIASDALPRYFAALQPAGPVPPRPAPSVTVTLVRWPYT